MAWNSAADFNMTGDYYYRANNNNNNNVKRRELIRSSIEFDLDDDDQDEFLMNYSINNLAINVRIGRDALNALNELRRSKMLCDAVITVDDATFHVHRTIMTAASPYFRAQFTGFTSISSPSQMEQNSKVEILGISGAVMEQLIQYAYIHKCIINAENVHELLIAADYVGMVDLVNQCKRQLAARVTTENCVAIMGFARFRFLDDLYLKMRRFTLRYSDEVFEKNTDILSLGITDFYDIVSDNNLNTREEDRVWKMCIKWINFDPLNRIQYVAKLMTAVRLGLMTPKCFLEEVKEHPYVLQCDEAKPLIVETFKFMYDLDIMNPTLVELVTPAIAMPRIPHEVIFAIGGWSGGSAKSSIETYDTRADRWISIPTEDPAGPRAYHGTAVIGFKLYTIGGYDGAEYFNTCRRFDAVRKTWIEISSMHSKRCYVSVAALDGLIYAIGGYDGHNRLNTVERYDPRTNQWTMIPPMNMQRSDASACTVGGKIFVSGGFNGQECLDSAEFFDPWTNMWTRLPNMNQRRSGVSSVAFRGQVFVIGGFNGTARLATGERYDPMTDMWSYIRPMNHSRSNFGLAIIDDMIFAIGGFNGVCTISHTECYVAETDEWMEATDMNIIRSALTASNVDGLPNVDDYVHQNREHLMEERRQRLLATKNAHGIPTSQSNTAMELQELPGGFENSVHFDQSPNNTDDERRLQRSRRYRSQLRPRFPAGRCSNQRRRL